MSVSKWIGTNNHPEGQVRMLATALVQTPCVVSMFPLFGLLSLLRSLLTMLVMQMGHSNTGAIVTELIGRTITRTYNDNFITIIYNMNV